MATFPHAASPAISTPLTDSSPSLYYFTWGRSPWHACVLWLTVPFFVGDARMPEEYEAELRRFQRILHTVTTHVQRADAVEGDAVELRRELYQLKAFLDGELS